MAEKILVVDDDIDSLKLIGMMLQRQGYDITAASSGQLALSKATAESPDLIILDVMMPDMDGYEVCRRLRANPATKTIPVIMFTAKSQVSDKVTGFEMGADDYLTKPVHPAELTSRVRTLIARRVGTTPDLNTGKLIGFMGVKGGVGTSTLALNVAAVLAQRESTILTDIRPGQSTLGLALNFGRAAGMSNLLSRPAGEISQRMIEAEIIKHDSGLRILPCSARVREIPAMNADTLMTIFKQLRTMARNVVVDLGAGLTASTMRLIRETTQLVLVVEPYRQSLSLARDLIRELEQTGIDRKRIHIVIVNRAQTSQQVPWQEAEQTLGHEMLAIIGPATDLILQAADVGQPAIAFQPTAMFTTQTTKLADELLRQGQSERPPVTDN